MTLPPLGSPSETPAQQKKGGPAAPSHQESPVPGAELNPSGASEAYGGLSCFHQDRHPALPRGEAQHLFHGPGVLQDIPVNDFIPLAALGLPGLDGKGSGGLAEDGDLFCHFSLLAGFQEIDPHVEKIHQIQNNQGVL